MTTLVFHELIKYGSRLPPKLHLLAYKRLSTVKFSNTDILKVLQNLDPNTIHGHDKISIRVLQICGISICRPLEPFLKIVWSMAHFQLTGRKET